FQAEEGIRDWSVTGVQTCALPISEIERVGLDYKYRPPVSRFGATRLRKVRPPNLSSLNLAHLYQASFPRVFSWMMCNPESTFAGCREYTSFRRSVIVFPGCCFRNSEIAVAYN